MGLGSFGSTALRLAEGAASPPLPGGGSPGKAPADEGVGGSVWVLGLVPTGGLSREVSGDGWPASGGEPGAPE